MPYNNKLSFLENILAYKMDKKKLCKQQSNTFLK